MIGRRSFQFENLREIVFKYFQLKEKLYSVSYALYIQGI